MRAVQLSIRSPPERGIPFLQRRCFRLDVVRLIALEVERQGKPQAIVKRQTFSCDSVRPNPRHRKPHCAVATHGRSETVWLFRPNSTPAGPFLLGCQRNRFLVAQVVHGIIATMLRALCSRCFFAHPLSLAPICRSPTLS
jgi:hypothetical protein